MKNQVFQTGNTFDVQTFSAGHARKVWRRIEEQLPGGFRITNVASFESAGIIRAGQPIVKDSAVGADEKDIQVLPWAFVENILGTEGGTIDSLNIIGFLQEDVPLTNAQTVATGNVIVKGEIYGYMLGTTAAQAKKIADAVKGMTQTNGLSIRVVD